MDFLELARKRYSARDFLDTKIEDEKINLILEAGRIAPTAVNYQPQRILVLNSEDSMDKLNKVIRYKFNQQLVFIVCFDKDKSWKRKYDNKDIGEIDASIVATHMMLEAENLGIGSTWIGHFDPSVIKETFSIPNNFEPVAILAMGYKTPECKPHPMHNDRLELDKTIFFESFE